MKLTKGKISKLYKKNKQSVRRKKGGKGKTGRNRTFRKNKGLNLANKSLKHFYNKYGGQAAVDPNAPAPAGESPTVLASSDPTATGESPTVLASSDPTATGESPTVLASSDPTVPAGESPTVLASSDPTATGESPTVLASSDPNAPPADPNSPPVADPAAPDPPGVVIDTTDPNPAGQSPGEVIDPNAATDTSAATSADASAAAPSSDTSAAPSSDTSAAAPSSDTSADTSAAPSPDASIVPGSPTVDTTDNFASASAPAPASGDNSASPASSGNMNQISNNSTSNDKITISGDPNQIVTLVSQLEKNGSQQGGVDPFSPNVSYAQAEGNSGLNLFSGTGGKSRKFKTTRKRRAKKSNKKTKCKK